MHLAQNLSPAELELTILMPCLNEAETIKNCIVKAREFLSTHNINGEILIADNGSTDGSQAIALAEGARVVSVEARGYGSALYFGTKAAHGRFVIMGDADDSYDFSSLQEFVKKLRAGFDLVMGNRFSGGINRGAMPWKNRYIGNPILSFLGKLFFKCAANDFHCGIRGIRKDSFDIMDLRTTGMEYASEMVIKSTLKGLKICEVPTTLSKDGRSRPPHLRPWRDGWRHLRFMLLFSPRWLFLYPGLFLTLFSFLVMLRLLYAPLVVRGVEFDVHTLVFTACGVLVGVQATTMALCSKAFAIGEGLLPRDSKMEWFLKNFSVERGLMSGVFVFISGLVLAISAFLNWESSGFGALDVREHLRVVIPSALLISLGVQVCFLSFLLGVLEMRSRRG